MSAPCDGWLPNHALCSTWSAADAATQAYADRVATRVIWAATGRQFGLCTATVRPCKAPQEPLYQAFPVGPYGEGYYNLQGTVGGGVVLFANAGCPCAGACMCQPPQVALPGPVASVTQVKVDGAVVDPAAYRVDQATWLVRTDGLAWPATQNLALPATQVGTFQVIYQQGQAVPDDLQDAAGLYACQVAKAITGGSCQLPNRVRSVTRSGVEIQYINEDDFLEKGRTGYDAVDSIINTYNPFSLVQAARFASPDLPTYR